MPVDADRSAHDGSVEHAAPGDAAAEAIARAASALGDLAQHDVPIGPMTTYRVGGAAALFVRVTSIGQLPVVAEAVHQSGLPLLVLGRGSNMLVADTGFVGIAVSMVDLPASIEIDRAAAQVVASAAVALPVLARKSAAAGLTGFEWAVGVPGSVGGAVRMNAGGHGSDIASSLVSIDCFDVSTNERVELDADALELGFRSSALRDDQLVLAAQLQLAPGDAVASGEAIREIVAWRREHQPGGQNAGSVFVNPVPGEVSAGALIDAAGLRGHRIGTAVVSDKHANFIQADEHGRADDVRALMSFVSDRVAESSGFRLRSEIRLVGFSEGTGY